MVSRQLNLFQCWNEPLTVFTPPTFDMGVIRSLFKKGVGTEIIASDSPPNCGMDVIAIIYRNWKEVMMKRKCEQSCVWQDVQGANPLVINLCHVSFVRANIGNEKQTADKSPPTNQPTLGDPLQICSLDKSNQNPPTHRTTCLSTF